MRASEGGLEGIVGGGGSSIGVAFGREAAGGVGGLAGVGAAGGKVMVWLD